MTDETRALAEKALTKTSASQVDEYEKCPRRWFNGYILGNRQPATDAMERGTAIHALVEEYLKTGKLDASKPYADLVASALDYLPKPGKQGLSVEEWIEMPTYPGGPLFVGRYDAIDASPDDELIPTGFPLVADVKSTSDFRYCKTPAQLKQNTQLGAYAAYVMLNGARFNLQRTDGVRVKHIYIRTKNPKTLGPKSLPVDVTLTDSDVASNWQRILTVIQEMMEWARLHVDGQALTAEVLPPNTDACNLYGGCFYRPQCNPLTTIRRDKMETQKTNGASGSMGLVERMKAQRAALLAKQQDEAPTTPPPRPMDTPAAEKSAPAPAASVEMQAVPCPECDGKKLVKRPSTTNPKASAWFNCGECKGTGIIEIASEEAAVGAGSAIVPPDAPSRTDEPVSAAPAPAPEETADEPEKKKRGRPRKDAVAEAQAAAKKGITVNRLNEDGSKTALIQNGEMTPEVESPTEPNPPVKSPVKEDMPNRLREATKPKAAAPDVQPYTGPVLYIDCVPVKGSHVGHAIHFEEWLQPIADEAAQRAGKADWRQIPYSAEGDLIAVLREAAALADFPPAFLVSGNSRARAPFLEVLIPHASAVFAGVAG